MSVKVDFSNMMSDVVGNHGIQEKTFESYFKTAQNVHRGVESKRGKGMQGWMDIPYNQDKVVARINETAKKIQTKFENFVVLGIGGSALGSIALFTALKHLFYNELPKSVRKTPKFYVIDNVDPERMTALLDVINVEETMFNVVTKSGATSETMSQYLLVIDLLTQKLGDKAHKHIIATTSKTKGNLIELAKENRFETFYIPEGVGGRFSVLSPVGLLPAAVVGIDIAELLRGARDMDQKCRSNDMHQNPALASAVLQYISIHQGKNISVMMPYADSLRYVADWYCQLWGESLGKAVDRNGAVVHVGQTPVKSLGVTDQHSQIQLYNEGPYDKVITFLEVENFRTELKIPEGCEKYDDVNFLCGNTFNDLMTKELYATRYNLTKSGRSNYSVIIDTVNEYNIGAFMYMFFLETAYMGELLNIDTYNQLGVEGAKNVTYALFGRRGFEHLKDEVTQTDTSVKKYVIE